MESTEALLGLIPALHKLNEGKEGKKYRDEFPVLNTEETNAEVWWDSLKCGKAFNLCGKRVYENKIEVGRVALRFTKKMSANYKWDCHSTKYRDLSKSQKWIISLCLTKKDLPYSMFDIGMLMGLQ